MNVLVVGESCRDIFSYGDCTRLCPEAPVPVFNLTKTTENGGMAMNVKSNLLSLGASVNIHTNTNWQSITKTRFIDYKTNHMFMRLDCGDLKYGKNRIKRLKISKYDAIVISDYDKGFLSEEDIEYLCCSHPLVFLDTKKILGPWCKNAKYIKINSSEYQRTKHMVDEDIENILIVTIGPDGCRHNGTIYNVPEVEIKDVSGAGDTFISGLCYKYVQTSDIDESIRFANKCSTEVVQKRGVTTVK